MLPLIALALNAPAPPAKAADWPVFRGDAAMTGVAVNSKLPAELAEKWKFKTGNMIEGAPIIVEGVVYVASADKHLYALDLATGKQKWKSPLGSPTKASPGFREGVVYVGNSDGMFRAFNAADGKELWKYECPGEINSGCNFAGDFILIGSYDGTLSALKADGKKAWDVKLDQPVNGTPAVAEGRTFLAGCDSILHVYDAATGKELGTADLGGQAAATAAVSGDFAYVGTMSNTVVAVELKAPKKLWDFEAKIRQQPFYSSAAVTEKFVYAGSRDKKLYALDRAAGRERWSFPTDGMVDASPVVAGGRVYCGCLSTDGNFYVLDATTGKKLQELFLGSAITGSAAVAGDVLLVGTEKGTLYCLGSK